jgi:probable phosphoglycerate mutase
VISDSELIVKQMKGQYRVNSPELRPLYEQARRLTFALEKFEIQHVLREKNRHADRLANLAMDRGTGKAPAQPSLQPEPKGRTPRDVLAPQPAPPPVLPPQPLPSKMLRGLVKGGVVHLLTDDLPDGTFVKVIPE